MRHCPLCQKEFEIADLVEHLEQCTENVLSCPFCYRAIRAADRDQHVLFECEKNIKECYICKELCPIAKFAEHVFSCGNGKEVTMFHGTSLENAKSIVENGFQPSTKGTLGEGVYLSQNISKAKHYGPVIVECVVVVGKTIVIQRRGQKEQKCWASLGFDSAWIPPCSSAAVSGLEEHCIRDPKRVAPLKYYSQC